MSTPGEYYKSLPPVSKTYGVLCLLTTSAYYFELYNPEVIYLSYSLALKRLQVWRLVTNFFFLAPFSPRFGVRLLMIARYWVLLEKGAFDKRTADFLWMIIFGALSLLVIAAIPPLWSPFMGVSLVFMLVYVWSREVPNAQISIYGVVTIKGFYLPWAFLALDLIFGAPLKPDIIGIVAGHLYYFLSVLHPLAGGRNLLKTPLWVYPLYYKAAIIWQASLAVSFAGANMMLSMMLIFCQKFMKQRVDNTVVFSHVSLKVPRTTFYLPCHKLVMFWGEGVQVNSPVQPNPSAGVAFRGRSYRLNQ